MAALIPPPDRPGAAGVETGDFVPVPNGTLRDAPGEHGPAVDQSGGQVGPYRLLRLIGTGGMATVWLAERADGLLQRQVALKVPRDGWSRGMAMRMARERDILAALEHPHIARLYDAGSTRDGRPWMAMEFVVGVPIDQYAREHALDVRQRLRLVLQIADAVSHAHTRLVVHRDLKPGNVLVTNDGTVRLLDFGAAEQLADDPAATDAPRQSVGAATLAYASPEQVTGGPVTVVSDLYALGVLMYGLLTDASPYLLARDSPAALEEAILTAAVPRASSRVSDRPQLARQLRGDIDAMLAKAMRKDPAERYTSIETFSEDLQRHLVGLPVLARPPTWRYRTQKFVRRRLLLVLASAAVAVSLLAGLGTALWQGHAARSQAARADHVKNFIASIFRQATPRAGAGGVVTAADLLSAAAQRIDAELTDAPAVAAELGVIVGEGFSMLGDPMRGEASLRAALARAQHLYGRTHALTLTARALLIDSIMLKDGAEAERLAAELLPDALAGLPASAEIALAVLQQKSFLLAKREQAEASYAALRQAIAIGERHLGPLHRQTIEAIGLLSNTYGRFRARAEQLATAEDALRRARQSLGAARPDIVLTAVERWYGEALHANERPADAVPVLRRVLQDQRALDPGGSVRVRNALLQLGVALDEAGRQAESLPLLREAMAQEQAQNPHDSDDRFAFASRLVTGLVAAQRVDEALALDVRLRELRQKLPQPPEERALSLEVRRAHLWALQGDFSAAEASNAAAVAAGQRVPRVHAEAQLVTAWIARQQDRPREAAALAQQVLAVPATVALRQVTRAAAATELGLAALELRDMPRAAQALQQAQALYTRAQVEPSVRMADCLVGQARLHLEAGKAGAALALLRPLAAQWQAVNPGSDGHGQTLHWLARAEALHGDLTAARRHRQAAMSMLRNSRLPALQRLVR